MQRQLQISRGTDDGQRSLEISRCHAAGNDHDKHAVAVTKETPVESLGIYGEMSCVQIGSLSRAKGREGSSRRRHTAAACGGIEVPCLLEVLPCQP